MNVYQKLKEENRQLKAMELMREYNKQLQRSIDLQQKLLNQENAPWIMKEEEDNFIKQLVSNIKKAP